MFSSNGTLISESAAPHCGERRRKRNIKRKGQKQSLKRKRQKKKPEKKKKKEEEWEKRGKWKHDDDADDKKKAVETESKSWALGLETFTVSNCINWTYPAVSKQFGWGTTDITNNKKSACWVSFKAGSEWAG